MKHFGTRDYIDIGLTSNERQVYLEMGQEGEEDNSIALNLTPMQAAAVAGEILGAAIKLEDGRIVGLSIMAITEDGELLDLGCTCE